MTELLDKILFHVALIPWETVLIYLGSAGVIIPITQYLKNKLNNKTKQKVFTIIGGLTALPAILDQLVQNAGWAQYLPDQFGWLFSAVILLHAFFGSPIWRRLNGTLLQYRQALQVVRESGSSTNAPISNPNLSLNTTPQPQQPAPEERPLQIQG